MGEFSEVAAAAAAEILPGDMEAMVILEPVVVVVVLAALTQVEAETVDLAAAAVEAAA